MGVLMCVVGIGIVCFCFPYIRCFLKRLSLLSKIKNACREKDIVYRERIFFGFLAVRAESVVTVRLKQQKK